MNLGVHLMGHFIDFFAGTLERTARPKGLYIMAYTVSPLFIAGIAAVYPSIWVVLLG